VTKHEESKDKEKHGKSKHEERIEHLEKEATEYKDTLQRLQAEFENFQKRIDREKIDFQKFASARTIESFLPLMDSVSEGIKQAKKSGNKEMENGFSQIRTQLAKIFETQGVKEIETHGEKFDYNLHECMMTVHEKDKADELILEEFQKGYLLNGKVLRPAKVKVNKKE